MNQDIRLLVNFKGHRKRKRLELTLGPGATGYLIDLWLTVAEDRPEGVLTDWDAIDIALAGGWTEDPQKFVDALMDCRWLECNQGVYTVHDWEEHQGWACGAKKREAAARKGAAARWDKRLGNAEIGKPQCDRNATAMRPHRNRNAPSPSPSPSPSLKEPSSKISKLADFYLTKRKRKLTGKRLETFNLFWEAFAYKTGKAEAADAWLDIPELIDPLVSQIVAAAKAEAARRPEIIAKGKIPKMAQGWISGRRWEDEVGSAKTKVYV